MVVKSLQSCGQQLPPKENALFKRLVKCYELKQYKNGLKFAKQILSNPSFAEHGETLAMKGLLLSSLGKKAEAHSAVDKGLRKNLASIVCWQAYAILHKNDRKYEEAIKGYKLALNRDNNNLEILRDLSVLQVHTRDFDGFLKTRGKILLLQPGLRASWITHAVAFHLLKDYDMALKTLEEFRKTYPVKQFDFEHSEVLLYQNFVMREAGLEAEALQHLATYEGQIVDKLAVQEIRAKMLLNMKDKEEEAISVCEQLLSRNPDNCDYYRNVELAHHPATLEEKLELYKTMSEKYAKAKAPKLLMLEFISGDLFRSEVDKFLVCYLRKGIPPLFKILRSLYSKTEKVLVIEELVLGYLENLKCSNSFNLNDSQCEQETPTSLLWTYFYLAQHYDFLDQTEKALEYINLALDHTMTLIELYVVKAKICKHAGDINEAVRCLDEAQSLDTADRYVNSKCAKYMLRANMMKEAESMCLKFTKEGSPAADTLHEMQCMWFLLESAALYRRTGQYGEALRKCHEISRHFNEIVEDQFDFHMYCMRKSTIRGYVEILRLEDVLKSHPNYFRAATMAIEIYLHLFDCTQSEASTDNECNQENLTPAELKKLRDKQRKKAKKEAAEKQKQEELHRLQQQRNKAKNYDPDLDGPEQEQLKPEKLAKPESPLAEALAFLRTLQQFASNRIETHVLAFKIFQRKGKLLLMLQSIKRAFAIEPNNPQLHECIIQFLQAVKDQKSLPELVEKVLLQEMGSVFGQKDAATVNAEFLDKNGSSLPHLLSGAKMIFYLDPSKKTEAVNLATNLSPELTGLSLKVCASVQESLCSGDFGKCEFEAEDYRTKCRAVFPHAAVFSLTTHNDVA